MRILSDTGIDVIGEYSRLNYLQLLGIGYRWMGEKNNKKTSFPNNHFIKLY